MILCGMVSKPYRVHYTQLFHLHTFSNFILENSLVSQIWFATSPYYLFPNNFLSFMALEVDPKKSTLPGLLVIEMMGISPFLPF